jgi:hypothetical protein
MLESGLESGASGAQIDTIREELIFFACAYLKARSARDPMRDSPTINRGKQSAPTQTQKPLPAEGLGRGFSRTKAF